MAKKYIVLFAVVFLAAPGVGTCVLWQKHVFAAQEGQEPVLENGQSFRYAKITSISGNEMQYAVLEPQTQTKDKSGAYAETDKTGQMQIPVGTQVETKLGTVTTFSRLAGGDRIKMLLQKDDSGSDVLLKIWIVE